MDKELINLDHCNVSSTSVMADKASAWAIRAKRLFLLFLQPRELTLTDAFRLLSNIRHCRTTDFDVSNGRCLLVSNRNLACTIFLTRKTLSYDRQTLTSPTVSVLFQIEIQHTLSSSDTLTSPTVSVLFQTEIQHALSSSDTLTSPTVKVLFPIQIQHALSSSDTRCCPVVKSVCLLP